MRAVCLTSKSAPQKKKSEKRKQKKEKRKEKKRKQSTRNLLDELRQPVPLLCARHHLGAPRIECVIEAQHRLALQEPRRMRDGTQLPASAHVHTKPGAVAAPNQRCWMLRARPSEDARESTAASNDDDPDVDGTGRTTELSVSQKNACMMRER